MEQITNEQIILINRRVTAARKMTSQLEDESTLNEIMNTIYEKDENNIYTYKNIYEQSAKMLDLFQFRHPFTKLNEYTAIISVINLFEKNNIPIDTINNNIFQLIKKMENQEYSYEELLDCLLGIKEKEEIVQPLLPKYMKVRNFFS